MRFGVLSGTKIDVVRGSHAFPGPPVLPEPPRSDTFRRWTVIVSIAIHAFALFGLFQSTAGLSDGNPSPTTIEVDFLNPPVADPEPEQATAPEPPPTPQLPQPPENLPSPPEPPPPEPPAPVAEPDPPLPKAPPPLPPPPTVKLLPVHKSKPPTERHLKANITPSPVVVSASVAPQVSSEPEKSGLLPLRDNSLAAYSRLIWERIERRKPRDIHAPGVATITFSLAANGALVSATLSVSSGIESLDRAALTAIAAAAPFPPPPSGASPAQLIFSIPFQFH